MRTETKQEGRQTDRKKGIGSSIYIRHHDIAHFSSGHKYLESGKKTEEQKKREKKGY
jgi:hypothetical protein